MNIRYIIFTLAVTMGYVEAYGIQQQNTFGRRYGPNSQFFALPLYYAGPQKKMLNKKTVIKKKRSPYETC